MLRKALALAAESPGKKLGWRDLMLLPEDFTQEAIHDPLTRSLMERMTFEHGGAEYDARYPDGNPTSIIITDHEGSARDSGLVMYPAGHARNTTADLYGILGTKFTRLASLASDDPADLIARLSDVNSKSVRDIASLYDFTIGRRETE
jgi:2-methylcitrate dehydratase